MQCFNIFQHKYNKYKRILLLARKDNLFMKFSINAAISIDTIYLDVIAIIYVRIKPRK